MKTTSYFIREIQKSITADPARAVRFDIGAGESKAIQDAYRQLNVCGRWSFAESEHVGHAQRTAGIHRAAVFGPDYPRPQPFKRVLCVAAAGREVTAAEWEKAVGKGERLRRQMVREHGRECFAEVDLCGFDGECAPGLYAVLWDGAAWMARQHQCFSLVEVALYLRDNIRIITRMEPDAARGRKQVNACRSNAPIGGKNTAHYTDDAIIQAFERFKRDNPKQSLWDAANALIRPGRELAKYKRVSALWNRIARMAQSRYSFTRDVWFDSL